MDRTLEFLGLRRALPRRDEQKFLRDYRGFAKSRGLSANPDDPRHHYNYRALWQANGRKFGPGPYMGVDPYDQTLHGSSRFKDPDHPTRYGIYETDFGYSPSDKMHFVDRLYNQSMMGSPPVPPRQIKMR